MGARSRGISWKEQQRFRRRDDRFFTTETLRHRNFVKTRVVCIAFSQRVATRDLPSLLIAYTVIMNSLANSYRATAFKRRVQPTHRGVAQPGRAPGSGPGGRRFKSSLPDQFFSTTCRISQFLRTA